MVNWESQDEISIDSTIFMKAIHGLIGLYAWEFIITLDFEWAILTGKKRFRWPLIFYFADRYLLLAALVGITASLDVPSEINCHTLYAFNQLAGNAAVGLASINLSLRTVAIWSQSKWIITLLVLLIFGHWSLILQGVLVSAAWVPSVGCQLTYSNTTILAAIFIYSMCLDLVVMCLSAYKLTWSPARSGGNGGQTKLISMLFSDGLIYFFIAFASNLIATTFMVLNLNATMSIIFNVPAAIASTIAACRAVRRLNNFQLSGTEMIAPKKPVISFRGSNGLNDTGFHVAMDTFRHSSTIDPERYGAYRPRFSAASYDVYRKPGQI